MIRALIFCCAVVLAPSLVAADAAFDRLMTILAVDEYIAITREEGLAEVDGLAMDMTGQAASPTMLQQMDQVYNTDRMRDTVLKEMADTLSDRDIQASLIFFDSAPGLRIAELEVAARRAIMDKDVENAARMAWIQAEETHPWLVARVKDMITINDLIERNVSGALNSNFRFFQGLAEGNGLEMSEEEMLSDVWAQEGDIRIESEAWLGGYLLLAYQPLSQQDLTDYLSFWDTDTGRALNAVLFSSFNKMYDDISFATGQVVAVNMSGQDL